MHSSYAYILFPVAFFLSASSIECTQKESFNSPTGYNLDHPEKFIMPDVLHEISGITFLNENDDMLYAEQDEEGKVFYLKPGDKKANHTKFGKSGDYEDIAICKGFVIMLRSDGTLYTFPFGEIGKPDATNVVEFNDLLPNGEYEGMYADKTTGQIFVLCKNCNGKDASKTGEGYILQLANDGKLSQKSNFHFSVKEIASLAGDKKIDFHPSALAKHPVTNEWFILSSVNKLLVIADINWNIKSVYKLSPSIYIQPEGITFDRNANLYISNEGGEMANGNVLKMMYTVKH